MAPQPAGAVERGVKICNSVSLTEHTGIISNHLFEVVIPQAMQILCVGNGTADRTAGVLILIRDAKTGVFNDLS